ncbi:MAG: DUF2007 domain-containing protein [Bacteroidota bacterium]
MSNQIKILTDSSITINRVAHVLDENGIPAFIKDNVEAGRLAGFGTTPNSVDLFINETDLEKASEIIASLVESN